MHYQTTTRLMLDAPYEPAYANVVAEKQRALKAYQERLKILKDSSFQVGLDYTESEHPCRLQTSQGQRLAPLRSHKNLPAFDTEARLHQRDAELSQENLYASIKREQEQIKAMQSSSRVVIAQAGDPFGVQPWNKRQEFATASATSVDFFAHQLRSRKGGASLWNNECETTYQTEAQIIHSKKKKQAAAKAATALGGGDVDMANLQSKRIKTNALASHWSMEHGGAQHEGRLTGESMPTKRGPGECKREDHKGLIDPTVIMECTDLGGKIASPSRLSLQRPEVHGSDSDSADEFGAPGGTFENAARFKKDEFNLKIYGMLRTNGRKATISL